MHIHSERCSGAFYKNLNSVDNTMFCILTIHKTEHNKVHWMQRLIHFMLHKSHESVNERHWHSAVQQRRCFVLPICASFRIFTLY